MFDLGPGAIACVHKELLETGLAERVRFHFGTWGWAVIGVDPDQDRGTIHGG